MQASKRGKDAHPILQLTCYLHCLASRLGSCEGYGNFQKIGNWSFIFYSARFPRSGLMLSSSFFTILVAFID